MLTGAGPGAAAPGRRRCAVLGDPVAHSLSPVLHAAAYADLGLDWAYTAERVPAGGLAAFLDAALADEAWRGFSLTMPLKREVLPLLADVGEQARRAGAANTVLVERSGGPGGPGGAGEVRLRGDNTDVPGAAAAVRERTDVEPGTVTVLGGGATATSTALALCDLGARRVRLLVRAADRARATAAAVAAHPAAPEVDVGDLATAAVTGDVVVSTVPAAAQDGALVARCADVPVVFEVLYDPWPTPLQAAARGDGRVLVTGLDLLVHQAVLQVGLMTGREVPVGVVRAAGERALAG